MMESIEKLRESLKDCTSEAGVEPNRFDTYWITANACDMLIDGIEREIAERYMPRPCDMDGVPIEIGDELSHDGFARNFIVHSYELVDGTWAVWDVANGATHICSACRHAKPRTLEDVLREYRFQSDCLYHDPNIGGEDRADALESLDAEYAAEIRDLMGVDR